MIGIEVAKEKGWLLPSEEFVIVGKGYVAHRGRNVVSCYNNFSLFGANRDCLELRFKIFKGLMLDIGLDANCSATIINDFGINGVAGNFDTGGSFAI